MIKSSLYFGLCFSSFTLYFPILCSISGCTYAASAIAASLSTRSPFNSDEAKVKKYYLLSIYFIISHVVKLFYKESWINFSLPFSFIIQYTLFFPPFIPFHRFFQIPSLILFPTLFKLCSSYSTYHI